MAVLHDGAVLTFAKHNNMRPVKNVLIVTRDEWMEEV